MKIRKLFGDKAFYRMVLAIAVPVMVQSGITQFVSLLDNLMVGRIGTEEFGGVAIANQLIFVFNLCIFGGLSGAGIFSAQFSGKNDVDGMRHVLRFKLYFVIAASVLGILILHFFGSPLISLFLHEGSEEGDLVKTLNFGLDYLKIMLIGLPLYAVSQCYASSLKETGETFIPMIGSGTAVLVNLVFNYILIFGKFGFPVMGVKGAAIATVLSRVVELAIIAIWAHTHTKRFGFFSKLYSSFRVPKALTFDIIKKGSPLMFNELLWSMGMSTLTACYSMRGLATVNALNISSTVSNLFNVVFMAIGSSIAIIVGNLLGAGKFEEARDTDRKIITMSVLGCFIFGSLLAVSAKYIPNLYETTDEVKSLATSFLLICAVSMPFNAFTHGCYFTLRSGGQTKITMAFDSCFVWVICIPLAYCLANFTSIPIIPMFIICTATELIKCVIGYFFVKSDRWVKNIVNN
ncbi:MAG: MATE family efflux transporter [Clostridiales bacterium]|nr:MATE family efflux transporter [Clostridiales bacterium]MDY5702494.1 MATE family efflux transporter [Eubacteriales bacterium]